MAGWLDGWLVEFLVGCLIGWLFDWLVGWLAGSNLASNFSLHLLQQDFKSSQLSKIGLSGAKQPKVVNIDSSPGTPHLYLLHSKGGFKNSQLFKVRPSAGTALSTSILLSPHLFALHLGGTFKAHNCRHQKHSRKSKVGLMGATQPKVININSPESPPLHPPLSERLQKLTIVEGMPLG